METNTKFGFCDIKHIYIDEVTEYLDKIGVEKYIVGMETVTGSHIVTQGEHMHFLLHISDTQMLTLRTHLKTKYNLGSKNSGKAYYGFSKQEVKSLEKIGSYTVKDNNFKNKGYLDEEIKKLVEESFPKKESLYEKIIEHLSSQQVPKFEGHIDFPEIEKSILKYYMEHNQSTTKSQIRSITRAYLHTHLKQNTTVYFEDIYNYTIST